MFKSQSEEELCGALWQITGQGQILLRCYLLGRQGPCRLWGLGQPPEAAWYRAQLAQRQEGVWLLRSHCHWLICRMCSASHLPGAATCERCGSICLVINMAIEETVGAELVYI